MRLYRYAYCGGSIRNIAETDSASTYSTVRTHGRRKFYGFAGTFDAGQLQ